MIYMASKYPFFKLKAGQFIVFGNAFRGSKFAKVDAVHNMGDGSVSIEWHNDMDNLKYMDNAKYVRGVHFVCDLEEEASIAYELHGKYQAASDYIQGLADSEKDAIQKAADEKKQKVFDALFHGILSEVTGPAGVVHESKNP